jgi:pyrroline-5-carboxylate reductase
VKIGIVGTGNMGEAILKGLLDNVVSAQDIVCVDKVQASVDRISQRYQVVCSTEISAIKDCDVVVLGVKPQNMDEVLPLIGKHINQNTKRLNTSIHVFL